MGSDSNNGDVSSFTSVLRARALEQSVQLPAAMRTIAVMLSVVGNMTATTPGGAGEGGSDGGVNGSGETEKEPLVYYLVLGGMVAVIVVVVVVVVVVCRRRGGNAAERDHIGSQSYSQVSTFITEAFDEVDTLRTSDDVLFEGNGTLQESDVSEAVELRNITDSPARIEVEEADLSDSLHGGESRGRGADDG